MFSPGSNPGDRTSSGIPNVAEGAVRDAVQCGFESRPKHQGARSLIGRRHDVQTVGSVGLNPSARTKIYKERSG